MERFFHYLKIIVIVAGLFGIYKYLSENGYRQERGHTRVSNIYSLNTTTNSTGNFFLGIGSYNGVDYYTFYRKTNSGALIREKFKTSKCYIFEGHPTPRMSASGQEQVYLTWGDTSSTRTFHRKQGGIINLYIPEGTITKKIDLNFN